MSVKRVIPNMPRKEKVSPHSSGSGIPLDHIPQRSRSYPQTTASNLLNDSLEKEMFDEVFNDMTLSSKSFSSHSNNNHTHIDDNSSNNVYSIRTNTSALRLPVITSISGKNIKTEFRKDNVPSIIPTSDDTPSHNQSKSNDIRSSSSNNNNLSQLVRTGSKILENEESILASVKYVPNKSPSIQLAPTSKISIPISREIISLSNRNTMMHDRANRNDDFDNCQSNGDVTDSKKKYTIHDSTHMNQTGCPQHVNDSNRSRKEDQDDFQSKLLSRLTSAENELKVYKKEHSKVIKKCSELEKENRLLHTKLGDGSCLKSEDKDLERQYKEALDKNQAMSNEIKDIKEFLSDYGLVWVGNNHQANKQSVDNKDDNNVNDGIMTSTSNSKLDGNTNNCDTNNIYKLSLKNAQRYYTLSGLTANENEKTSDHDDNIDLNAVCIDNHLDNCSEDEEEISYEILAKRIQELNDTISSEPTQVMITHNKTAKLVNPSEMLDTIDIAYYRNGILIKRGPFRCKNSTNYRNFVRDVCDGYYPSEFKNQYPNGVIFNLIDRSSTDYSDQSYRKENALKVNKALSRIPKTIIKNGEVITMRQDIEDIITGSTNNNSSSILHNTSNLDNRELRRSYDGTVPGIGDDTLRKEKDSRALSNTNSVDHSKLRRSSLPITPTNSANYHSNKISDEACHEESKEKVDIAVKWLNGISIKMKFQAGDTIGDVRYRLQRMLRNDVDLLDDTGSGLSGDFVLRCVYPTRIVLNDRMVLVDIGLCPNGNIYASLV